MRKKMHSPETGAKIVTRDPAIDDLKWQSEIVMNILSDAEPDGIGIDEFRRMAIEKGIDETELIDVLTPLMHYANMYFNASNGKYHYLWSSPIQWE